MKESDIEHNCPICNKQLKEVQRYPNYVCIDCSDKATDINGRKLQFYNLGFGGGFEASFVDNNEIYNSHFCYIDNIKCFADEARFGGIVIEKYNID